MRSSASVSDLTANDGIGKYDPREKMPPWDMRISLKSQREE